MYDHLPVLPYEAEGHNLSPTGMQKLPEVTCIILSQILWRVQFALKMLSLGLATLWSGDGGFQTSLTAYYHRENRSNPDMCV